MVDCVLPRYLRKVEVQKLGESAEEQRREAQLSSIASIHTVKWLPNFITMPSYWLLSDMGKEFGVSHKDLNLYPMDISSALPVLALDINRNESSKILDLCCCPGGKLQYLRELAGEGSFIFGVDIADQRLNVCRSLLHCYQSRMTPSDRRTKRMLLFNCDGREFGPNNIGKLLYDSDIILNLPNSDKFKLNKSTRKRYERELLTVEQQLIRAASDSEIQSSPLFSLDYVLVDAECTHDASYRHLRHLRGRNKWNKRPRSEDKDFWDEEVDLDAWREGVEKENTKSEIEDESDQCAVLSHGIPMQSAHMDADIGDDVANSADKEGRQKLELLQRQLLQNGFRMLRPGGVLVYSTCSSDTAQNEDIVKWLLDTEPLANLEPALPHLFSKGEQHLPSSVISALQAAEQGVLQSMESSTAVHAAADELCQFFASTEKPLLQHGSLPGTIRVGAEAGMSGHFVARIRKRDT